MQRLVTVVVFSVLTSAIATADDANRERAIRAAATTFATLDRNADNRLSRSEAGYDRTWSEIFADTDVDGDGFVSPLEYAAATNVSPGNGNLASE